jgi:hypothetical protein
VVLPNFEALTDGGKSSHSERTQLPHYLFVIIGNTDPRAHYANLVIKYSWIISIVIFRSSLLSILSSTGKSIRL